MAALVAVGLLAGLSASAQVTIFDQTFDAPFGPTQSFAYGYFGGDITNSVYSVVTNVGTAGTSALVLSNNAAALGNGYGYAAVAYQETGLTLNTNTSDAAYTLSFDARCSGGNTLEVRVVDLNGGDLDTAPTPPGYGNDLTLTTNYTHYSLNLGDPAVFQGGSGPFSPITSQWVIVFQNNGGGGGIPPAWTLDIDNVEVTMVGTVPPPPPVTIHPPITLPQGLDMYAGTEGNGFYDRQDMVSVQSSGLGWVGRATAGNPVIYSFTVNSAPVSELASFQMYLVPNLAPNNGPDWAAPAMVETFLSGDTTSATLRFTYKVNQANGNTMLLGQAPYTNAPGSWNGVTSPYYESGALGTVTSASGILGTWTLKFTSSSNVTLIAPDGSNTNLVIPPYNTQYLAESTSFNVYLACQPEELAAINQTFSYGNFAVTGVVNPFSDNFLADTTLNTNIWNNGVSTSPANVFLAHGRKQLLTWSKPAVGYSLQDDGALNNGTWTDLTQGPNTLVVGSLGQVVSTNELPPGNAAYFRLIHRQFSQLQVLFAGQTNAPGTALGYVGSPTPISLTTDSGIATVTINAVDSTFHIISGANDKIHIVDDSGAGNSVDPNDTQMVNGSLTTDVLFETTGSFHVTASDVTSTNITSGTTPVPITVNN
jgi:hypothetical protein